MTGPDVSVCVRNAAGRVVEVTQYRLDDFMAEFGWSRRDVGGLEGPGPQSFAMGDGSSLELALVRQPGA